MPRRRKHVWFESTTPEGNTIRIKGDPNMDAETRDALGQLMDLVAKRHMEEKEAAMQHKIYDVTDGNTVVWAWTPKQDISTYELALCMPIFSTRVDSGSKGHSIGDLPDAAKRHFTKVG